MRLLKFVNVRKKVAEMLVVSVSALSFGIVPVLVGSVRAAVPGAVVINEVAWAGSADSANDEWIELYNGSNQAVDLAGWTIKDDGTSTYTIASGSISAHGYFLIEDHEAAVASVTADAIVDLSLANAGDSLELFNASQQLVDAVNSSGGAWFAGSSTTNATMERKDALTSGDGAANWGNSTGSGTTASGGAAIIGTPRLVNSVNGTGGSGPGNPQASTAVDVKMDKAIYNVGDIAQVTLQVNSVAELFAYGFELNYNPTILRFKSAEVGNFLSEDGDIATSFQTSLENGTEGKLLLAEARTIKPAVGRTGSGDLVTLEFDILAATSQDQFLQFGTGSFLANTTSDIATAFHGATYTVQDPNVSPVTNLQAVIGTDRYSIRLTWDTVNGATGYKVSRKDRHGQWVVIGTPTVHDFLDKDGVTNGGFIIPQLNYVYRVVAVKGTFESPMVEVTAQDARGLKGDNDRTDRVDGRDLEKLAHQFGFVDTDQGFDALIDTTYDGQINGSDLIDIGITFGKKYTIS